MAISNDDLPPHLRREDQPLLELPLAELPPPPPPIEPTSEVEAPPPDPFLRRPADRG